MNTEIIAKLLLIVLLSVSVSCQEDLVYRGTGVDYDGRRNRDFFDNHTIILGGVFSIHTNENNECTRILPYFIQDIEAMALTIDRINNDTNILPGVTLAYEIRDTCILPNYALFKSHYSERTFGRRYECIGVGVSTFR